MQRPRSRSSSRLTAVQLGPQQRPPPHKIPGYRATPEKPLLGTSYHLMGWESVRNGDALQSLLNPESDASLSEAVLSSTDSRLQDAGHQTTAAPKLFRQCPLCSSAMGTMTQKLLMGSLPPSWNSAISFLPRPHLPTKYLRARPVSQSLPEDVYRADMVLAFLFPQAELTGTGVLNV